MNPLNVATRGLLCENTPESIATRGYFCYTKTIVVKGEVKRGGDDSVDYEEILYERLIIEDNEVYTIIKIFMRCQETVS